MCSAARRLADTGLLDFSGGNLSLRVSGAFYVTPKYAGEEMRWDLLPEHLVEVSLAEETESLPKRASRESWMHYELYRLEPSFAAVIHTHQKDLLSFACAGEPLKLPNEVEGFPAEVIPLTEPAPAGTRRLALAVRKAVSEHFAGGSRAGVLIPGHGAVVVAESLRGAVGLLAAIASAAYVEIACRQAGLAE